MKILVKQIVYEQCIPPSGKRFKQLCCLVMQWEKMEVDKILGENGFTQNEVKAYLAMLKIGRSTSYSIVKEANVSSGKIYETLDRLVEKGIASHVTINGKKYFDAADPKKLLEFMERKQERLRGETAQIAEIIPQLQLSKAINEEKTKAEIFEGINGIKTIYETAFNSLKSGETYYVFGSKKVGKNLDGFFDKLDKKRVRKNIFLKIILGYGQEREEKLRKSRKISVRIFPKNVDAPAWVVIFGDYVATINVVERPIAFLIKNRQVADSYRQFFELLWKMAK